MRLILLFALQCVFSFLLEFLQLQILARPHHPLLWVPINWFNLNFIGFVIFPRFLEELWLLNDQWFRSLPVYFLWHGSVSLLCYLTPSFFSVLESLFCFEKNHLGLLHWILNSRPPGLFGRFFLSSTTIMLWSAHLSATPRGLRHWLIDQGLFLQIDILLKVNCDWYLFTFKHWISDFATSKPPLRNLVNRKPSFSFCLYFSASKQILRIIHAAICFIWDCYSIDLTSWTHSRRRVHSVPNQRELRFMIAYDPCDYLTVMNANFYL